MAAVDLDTLGVVGAGQMGAGIAQVAATAGLSVILSDVSLERAESGKASIDRLLARLVTKGKLDEARRGAILARILVADVARQSEAELVVEAASENVELKLALFRKLDAVTRPGAILASNTSSISITRLAAATGRPERVVGMHFMNPVPLMKLVEIVRGVQTSEQALDVVRSLAGRLGKTVVVSQDSPGFIVNRILIPLLNEACFALAEGLASAEDIDTGARLGLNHPMGPLELSDLIGLDTVLAIADVLHRDFGDDKYRAAPLLRNLVHAGWLGKKVGRGFYVYEDGKKGAAAWTSGLSRA